MKTLVRAALELLWWLLLDATDDQYGMPVPGLLLWVFLVFFAVVAAVTCPVWIPLVVLAKWSGFCK